jgi:hypothetical protein
VTPQSATGTSSVLQLGSVGAWLVLALFLGTQVVLATLNPLPNLVLDFSALLLTCVAGAVLAIPGDSLPLVTTVIIAAVPTVVATLMSFTLPASLNLGYSAWHFGADGFLMFFLALRNRPGWAWMGLAGMWAVTLLWSMTIGLGVGEGISLVVREAGILAIGTVFNLGFTRTSARISALQHTQLAKERIDAEAQAAIETRIARSAHLDTAVTDILKRLSAGSPLSDEDRASCLLLEASLRDSVRARALYREPVVSEARAARARGVEVTLLDDSGCVDLSEVVGAEAHGRLAIAVAQELRKSGAGRFTARVLPTDRGILATITRDTGGPNEILEVGRDGLLA